MALIASEGPPAALLFADDRTIGTIGAIVPGFEGQNVEVLAGAATGEGLLCLQFEKFHWPANCTAPRSMAVQSTFHLSSVPCCN